METKHVSLDTLLDVLSTHKNGKTKKRLLLKQDALGGISLKKIVLLFIALPILLFAGLFNPWMFEVLGIAQAVIFFVVFLSMVMLIVFGLSSANNNTALRRAEESWKEYFPDIDLKQALSSGSSPYKDFLSYVEKAKNEGLSGDALYQNLKNSFSKMQEDNKDLIEAMQRNK